MNEPIPNPTDYTAEDVCTVYGWTREHLAELVHKGNFPAPDYVHAREPRWHEPTVIDYTRKLAMRDRDQTLKHLEDLAPDLAAIRRVGEDDGSTT